MRSRLVGAGAGLLVAVVVVFGVVAPPEHCPEVTEASLRGAAEEAVDWLVRNQEPDGQWLYRYDADTATAYPEYNVIRHAGVMMSLYQAAGAGMPGALAAADRGLGWAMDRLAEEDDWTALRSGGELPAGATALLTAGLAERRLVTGDSTHDELLGRLGRFLVEQTEPSGAVLASYRVSSAEPIAGVYSRYYTGEAYWALSRLHLLFPDDEWGSTADRIGGYMAERRDDVEGYWPPLPDHWAAYGQSETVTFPERGDTGLSAAEAAYARRQAGLFGGQVRWLSQRAGPWGALVRGPFVPRGGGYGVIGEALTGLWLTSAAEPELAEVRPEIAARARCVAGLALAAQSDDRDATAFAEPDRVRGAWFRDGETRMDDQQHALSGLLRTIPIVQSDADGEAGGDSGPSAWLWVVLLVAALNPFRAAFGVPRAGRSRRDVAVLAGLGGLVGATVVLAVGAIGGVIVDALDASEAALRIGAGAVAVIVGIVDLLQSPPAPEPALPGWRAALVPVAVPLVARPGLLILAMAAGAAGAGWATAGALAGAIGVLVVIAPLAPVDDPGPGARVLLWAARVTGAVLMAASVILVVGGVLDV